MGKPYRATSSKDLGERTRHGRGEREKHKFFTVIPYNLCHTMAVNYSPVFNTSLNLKSCCRCWFSIKDNQLVYTKSHKVGKCIYVFIWSFEQSFIIVVLQNFITEMFVSLNSWDWQLSSCRRSLCRCLMTSGCVRWSLWTALTAASVLSWFLLKSS